MDSPELFELVSTHARTLNLIDSYELNLLAASIIKIFTSTLDSNELLWTPLESHGSCIRKRYVVHIKLLFIFVFYISIEIKVSKLVDILRN